MRTLGKADLLGPALNVRTLAYVALVMSSCLYSPHFNVCLNLYTFSVARKSNRHCPFSKGAVATNDIENQNARGC